MKSANQTEGPAMSMLRLFSATVLSLLYGSATAQTTGSIFTTDRNGAVVNGNTFNQKRDVYLGGGPGPSAPCTSAGLPAGHYYFQVTNPSGTVLLSQDVIQEREVIVQGGIITGTVTNSHATRPGPCGSRIVQLIPFADTTNIGGEYKVWMTPVGNWDPAGSGFFGFQASRSKTDNFKIKSGRPVTQSIICGFKFFDHNENHVWDPAADPLEVPIAGWRIELWRGSALDDLTYTDENGRYCFIRDLDNTVYNVREIAPGGFIGDNIPGAIWLAMTPRAADVAASAATVAGPNFGNLSFEVKPGVGRTKGFWSNQNGAVLLQACDPQWRQVLYVRKGLAVALRTNISSADPNVSLFIPPFPTLSSPPPAFFALTFGNAQSAFSSWIVGDPALGHAGFMLSTQVAAAILNNACGYMQFTAYIDRYQNGILWSFDEMVAGATGLLRDPGAGLTGPHDPNQKLREMMLMCTNEFGSINETGTPSSPQVVYGSTFSPKGFSSPY
jgi:hypothetical protein